MLNMLEIGTARPLSLSRSQVSDEEVALATAFGLAQLTDFEAATLIERNHFRTGETPKHRNKRRRN